MGAKPPPGGGPHWPATDDEAVEWLRQRGGPADQRLAERTTLANVVLTRRMIGLKAAAVRLVDALGDMGTIRAARTNRERIGSYHCDSAGLKLRYLARQPIGRGATVVLLSAALAVVISPSTILTWAQIALVAVGLACVGRKQIGAIALLTVSVAATVAVRPATWWECGYTLFAGWCLVHFIRLAWLTAGPWWTRGSVLGFVPLRTRLLLRVTGDATMLTVAVDLATSSRAAAAAPFVTACRSVPKAIEPVVEMCTALVDADNGEMETALRRAAHAVDSASSGPESLHGWCLAQLASVLQQSGSADAAIPRAAALARLTARSCRRIHRDLQLSVMRYELTAWPPRIALVHVHQRRIEALRRHDYDLLHLTEIWLVRLMLAQGNNTGAEFLLRVLVGGSDGRSAMHAQRDETPDQLLLRAGVRIEGSLDQRDIEGIRRDVHVALALLDAERRPLAATAAYLLLAKLDHAAGEVGSALANAGYSLVAAQHGRYMLPTPRWRQAWDLMQLDAHATALEYAAEGMDSALVAEIIELTRGEVLPAAGQPSLLSPLTELETDLDLDLPVRPAAPGARSPLPDSTSSILAFQGLNPVRQPPRVRIGPRLRLEPLFPASTDIDLDIALQATAPRTWYWTGVTVIDRYYWAVRSPEGQWSHGYTSMAPGTAAAAAYHALGQALPFAMGRDDTAAVIAGRVDRGPLGRAAGHVSEYRLLREVARAFLPAPLAAGLWSEPAPVRLVVSLPSALGHLPVAGLPLHDQYDLRVVEKAAVVHVPSWSVATAARTRVNGAASRWPARLAVFAPSGGEDTSDLAVLARPSGVERTVSGPLSRTQLRHAVHAVSSDRDWLMTVIGHVVHHQDKPAESGLKLNGGYLTLADLLTADPARRLSIPERVLLIGCGSLGFASPAAKQRLSPTSEWLGLSAAVVLAGAADVCCTLYTVYANDQMARIIDGLVDGLSRAASAPEALRQVQLAELNRWRTVGDNYPVQWLALAYVGTGCDP